MAEDAVDAAIKSGKLSPENKCMTSTLQLIGADGWDPASFTILAQQYKRMKWSYGGKVVPGVMDSTAAKHLSHAYGTFAERVAAIAQVCFPSRILYGILQKLPPRFGLFRYYSYPLEVLQSLFLEV